MKRKCTFTLCEIILEKSTRNGNISNLFIIGQRHLIFDVWH